ncbi:cyclic nucleotide-binding domain-containing protein [Marinobacter halodurans]|uniref:Cyclic nucleotide-binding domain-containing protein n=2 Tax=Marinobacter halodurans TaxID=2528979 RepID=A0ABY1ZQX0_9GAMM|nr:cyclic nucleotide-binding domain-containing protein [Marinobacter halodurans]
MDMTESANPFALPRSCSHCRLGHLCLPRACSFQELGLLDTVIGYQPPYPPKQRIFSQGSPFHSCYVVKSGSVKTVYVNEQGEEKVLGFYLPSEMFGFEGIFQDSHTCSAIALERTTICHISFRNLEQLATQLPSLQHWMFRMMSHELNILEQLNRWLSQNCAEERIIGFLLDLSARQSARNLSPTRFRLTMNRSDIANFLGMALETVSRILARLQRDRLLDIRGREVIINDLATLNRFKSMDDNANDGLNRHLIGRG